MTRKQYPVRLALILPQIITRSNTEKSWNLSKINFFTHGKFYVSCSHIESGKNLKIRIPNSKDYDYAYTDNVIYTEIL